MSNGGDPKPDSDQSAPPLPDEAVDAVSQKIKTSYDQILSEPVPDRFLDLLKKLDQSSKQDGDASLSGSARSQGE